MQHGSDPNILDKEGFSPVHFCARNGSLQCLTVMQEVIDEYKRRRKNKQKLKIKVKEIDPDLRTKSMQTALHLCSFDRGAFRKHNSSIASLLIKLGADVNALDSQGGTPLHSASYYGAWEISNILLQAGADNTKSDFKGRIPLDVCMSELTLHINLGSVEQKLLKSKLTALLRPSSYTKSQHTQNDSPSLSQSAEGRRKRGHSRNKSMPSVAKFTVEQDKLCQEIDKTKAKEFRQEAMKSLENEIAYKILLQFEGAPSKYKFLSFHKNWTCGEAKEFICKHFKLGDPDLFGLFILGPRNSTVEMQNEKLISIYKLPERTEILFLELDSRFNTNSGNHAAFSSAVKKKKKKKINTLSKRNSKRDSIALSTLDILSPLKFWSNNSSPSVTTTDDDDLSIEKVNIKITRDDSFIDSPRNNIAETPPFYQSSHVNLSKSDNFVFNSKNDDIIISDSDSNSNCDSKNTFVHESVIQKKIEENVIKRTLELENELCRMKIRVPMQSNQRHAPISLPRNRSGLLPQDCDLWCPSTLWELKTMKNQNEKVKIDQEGKKMQKMNCSIRLDRLLLHYNINLPPGYPFIDAANVFYDFIVFGDEVIDELYNNLQQE